jgi:hypothetical protein
VAHECHDVANVCRFDDVILGIVCACKTSEPATKGKRKKGK